MSVGFRSSHQRKESAVKIVHVRVSPIRTHLLLPSLSRFFKRKKEKKEKKSCIVPPPPTVLCALKTCLRCLPFYWRKCHEPNKLTLRQLSLFVRLSLPLPLSLPVCPFVSSYFSLLLSSSSHPRLSLSLSLSLCVRACVRVCVCVCVCVWSEASVLSSDQCVTPPADLIQEHACPCSVVKRETKGKTHPLGIEDHSFSPPTHDLPVSLLSQTFPPLSCL